MTDRVDYFKFSTLVRPEKHSLDEAPFDATAFYDWDCDNEFRRPTRVGVWRNTRLKF